LVNVPTDLLKLAQIERFHPGVNYNAHIKELSDRGWGS
jgi:hypothetical protein